MAEGGEEVIVEMLGVMERKLSSFGYLGGGECEDVGGCQVGAFKGGNQVAVEIGGEVGEDMEQVAHREGEG